MEPVVWRVQWPKDITDAIVSSSNPQGTVTNSDLEMAGVLLHESVLETTVGAAAMVGAQTAIGCDNSPAVSWTTRMATRSESHIAFRLLRGLAMRQRHTRSGPPAIFHVAGVQNTLADVASRPLTGVASHFHLLEKHPSAMCPQTFLTLFDSSYPLPQKQRWRNVQPPSGLWSNVISTLRGQPLALRQWTTAPDTSHGKTGAPTPASVRSIPGCDTTQKPHDSPTSLPLPQGFELESSGMRSRLDSKVWKKPSVTWHKPSSWLDTTTPAEHTGRKSSTSRSGTF